MTFEAFNAHLTQIICPFRINPSPLLFRLYFSLEIRNPCSKELLTRWTCVVLVNAAIEVSRLVKTCSLSAALEFVVSGECKPGHSSWGVCSLEGLQGEGGGPGSSTAVFPPRCWPWQRVPHGISL